jgi:hypothetical protein
MLHQVKLAVNGRQIVKAKMVVRDLFFAGLVLGLSACSALTTKAPASSVVSSWVVMGEGGEANIRVLSSLPTCPQLVVDDTAQTMQVRAPAGTVTQRKTASTAEDSKASHFAYTTCEYVVSASVKKLTLEGAKIALPKAQVNRIVVIGDTGCRMKKADDAFQACNDEKQWGFSKVAMKAAGFNPDLVIHVGDYHYRENPCPAGNAGCTDSPWGYGDDVWLADLFQPAAPLLKVAPWVMVRGNHESCARAGQGYWRFLDPRPYQAGRDCDLEKNDLQGDFSAPYAVQLGVAGNQTAQLIIFDSSKVPGKKLAKTDPAYAIYAQQFRQVDALAEQADFNIFMNHHPILGFAAGHKEDGRVEFKPGNQVLQSVMQENHPQRLFPAKVQALLSGHTHLFEAVSFKSDHPAQFVSGNGGTAMDGALPNQTSVKDSPFAEAQVDHFSNSNALGFLVIDRAGENWLVQAYDQTGVMLTRCLLQNKTTNCSTNLH